MRTIAVVNQKGGCGKTTISINLASALSELGRRTLLVDMDPQSHCAVGLAVPEEQVEQSIYDVLICNARNEPIRLSEIVWQINDNLELAPSNIDLSAFEQQMHGITDRECCLRNVLEDIKKDYDYVVIDCPPAVGLLTFNALRAATDVIVPVETGYFSLHGLSKQLETLDVLCQRYNQMINVFVLASMYDIRTKMAREVLSELRKHFGEKMFKTTVNFNTKIKEAASFGQPIGEYDPSSRGQFDFRNLAEEIIGSTVKNDQHELVNSLAGQLESISSSADELLKIANQTPAKEQMVSKQRSVSADTVLSELDTKLSDYYGVNQIKDAVVFVSLYPRASKVQIAGDFNGWRPELTEMEKVGDSGIWQMEMKLEPGRYQYRIVVDGQWQPDPYNGNMVVNPFGDHNSVVEVN